VRIVRVQRDWLRLNRRRRGDNEQEAEECFHGLRPEWDGESSRSQHNLAETNDETCVNGLEAAETGPRPTSQIEHEVRARLEYFVKMFVRIHRRILITVTLERHAMCDFANVTNASRHRA